MAASLGCGPGDTLNSDSVAMSGPAPNSEGYCCVCMQCALWQCVAWKTFRASANYIECNDINLAIKEIEWPWSSLPKLMCHQHALISAMSDIPLMELIMVLGG